MDGGWLLPVITVIGAKRRACFLFGYFFFARAKKKVKPHASRALLAVRLNRPGEGGNLGSMTGNVNSRPTGKSDERPSIHAPLGRTRDERFVGAQA